MVRLVHRIVFRFKMSMIIAHEGNKPAGCRLRSDHERALSRIQIFRGVYFNRVINDLNASCAEVDVTAVENRWLQRTTKQSLLLKGKGEEEKKNLLPHRIVFLLSPGEHVASGMCAVLYIGIPQRWQFSPLVAASSLQRRWNDRL